MAKKEKEVKMLTVKEVAARVGAGESSIRIWAAEGRFEGAARIEPPAGVPYWMIPESALDGFVKLPRGRPVNPESRRSRQARKGKGK